MAAIETIPAVDLTEEERITLRTLVYEALEKLDEPIREECRACRSREEIVRSERRRILRGAAMRLEDYGPRL